MTVRTRFAPSPTGYLHIGGVRTALFCWLFARRHGGQFILRIDDTDQQRNVEEALAPILHGLHWLGIDWDEGPEVGGPYGPYYQSQRGDRYQAAVEKLLACGAAYYDYATTEELQSEREAAERAKQVFLYSRRFMAETAADRTRFEAEGRKASVRLKMPRQGTLVIKDVIRGDVAVDWAREQDHVVQRADGSFLYHLANVVDDYDFKITHVIRAEEHLSNTPRQIFIAQSLGYELPVYAHLPFVAEPGSKTKLSKRKLDKYLKNADFAALMKHGRKVAEALGLQVDQNTFNPVVVDFYEQVGYLPEAIINYLALLGWALDDRAEHFSREELIRHFSLERVNKAAASFDPKKLWAFQDWHEQQLPLDEKVERVVPYLQRAGLVTLPLSKELKSRVSDVVTAAGGRIKTAGDVLDYAYFFVADGALQYDEKAVTKWLEKPHVRRLLARYRERLTTVETFDPQCLESLTNEFVRAECIKIGDVVHVIRVAITGQSVGLGLFESLAILGKERCLYRIASALRHRRQCSLLLFLATPAEEDALADAAQNCGLPFEKFEHHPLAERCYWLGAVGRETIIAIRPGREDGKIVMGAHGRLGSAARGIRFREATGALGIIQLGMAFGIDPNVQKVGDVLVSSSLIPYDNRDVEAKPDGGDGYVVKYARASRQPARPELLELFRREKEGGAHNVSVHVGAILSGAARIRSRFFRDELRDSVPGGDDQIVGGEMEGVGLLAASIAAEDPIWCVVKGISDFADRPPTDEDRYIACRNAAAFVLSALVNRARQQ